MVTYYIRLIFCWLQAVERGIIDAKNGLYVDPITGKAIPISQAIDMGLVDVTTVDTRKHDSPDGLLGSPNAKYLNKDIVVLSVTDPRSGREISLERAIQEGIIDPKNGLYMDPVTGEVMSLIEALKRSYLKARIAEPGEKEDVIKARILQISAGKNDQEVDLEGLLKAQGTPALTKPQEMNVSIFSALRKRLDVNMRGIRELTSGKDLTIQEAFDGGVLEMSPLRITNADGDKFSLQEATMMGIVNPVTAKELLTAIEPYGLQRLIDQGLIDPVSGEFIDPNTGIRMTLKDAIVKGLIDPDMVFYTEGPSNTIMTLGTAIDDKKFDPKTGRFVDPKTGQSLSIAEASVAKVIDPNIDAQKITDQISALRFLRAFMDTSTKGIKDPRTGKDISVEEAVLAGILDIQNVEYVNLDTEQSMSIPEAVDAKLIDPKTAKKIFGAISKMALGEAIMQAQIDPNTGKFIHPDTKRKLTVKDAIETGLLDPATVFFVDPTSNKVTSLSSFIEEGRFNPVTGKFKDPLTNLEISISNAVKKGIIDPHIDPDVYIEEKLPIQELLDSGKVSASKGIFVAPDGQQMSLKEALSNGYLTPASLVKVDHKTGHVTIADDGVDIVRALMDTKKSIDWLTGVETGVASQPKPSEDLAELDEQLTIHKVGVHTSKSTLPRPPLCFVREIQV